MTRDELIEAGAQALVAGRYGALDVKVNDYHRATVAPVVDAVILDLRARTVALVADLHAQMAVFSGAQPVAVPYSLGYDAAVRDVLALLDEVP